MLYSKGFRYLALALTDGSVRVRFERGHLGHVRGRGNRMVDSDRERSDERVDHFDAGGGYLSVGEG